MEQKEENKLKKGTKVLITAKVLYRNEKGKSIHKSLDSESGTIAKIDA